jgi:hypothetical protein
MISFLTIINDIGGLDLHFSTIYYIAEFEKEGREMSRLIRIASVIGLALLVVVPVHAQGGGLTGEQQALVDRLVAALEKTESCHHDE